MGVGTGSQITVWLSRKFTVGQHVLSPALQRGLLLLQLFGTWVVLFGHFIISILKWNLLGSGKAETLAGSGGGTNLPSYQLYGWEDLLLM